jgi:hypothetical protein
MRTTTRLTTASLASVLSAGVLGAPAAALAAGGGQGSEAPVPQSAPTWPTDPQVLLRPDDVAADSGSTFDWESAGMGAATVLGVFAMGTAGVVVVRRRRVTRVSLSNH